MCLPAKANNQPIEIKAIYCQLNLKRHINNPSIHTHTQGVVAEYLKDVPPGKYLCFEAAIASAVPLGSVRGLIGLSGWVGGCA